MMKQQASAEMQRKQNGARVDVIGAVDASAVAFAKELLSQKGLLSASHAAYMIFPGFCDVHVHLREPGFSHKETVKTGTLAAARGGYTTVCSMPNLNPVPDSPAHLREQLALIRRDAVIEVKPYGAITVGEQGGELSELAAMAPDVCGFSDDGRGVQNDDMMRKAMKTAKALDKPIVAHCEVNELLHGGYIHDGEYARAHGHRGICSESEYAQVARDLALVREIGCRYHVCHISTKESVALIRQAKAEGLDVTCETGPHYLIMTDADLQEHGNFKMNPPLRSEADRDALLEGIRDGTIDMIATDHAPHSQEEKSRGLANSPFGIVGLETAFPLLYTHLVKTGVISAERLGELLSVRPRERFALPAATDFTVFEVATPYRIDPDTFLSMGRNMPFAGWEVYGRCVLTVHRKKVVYEANP